MRSLGRWYKITAFAPQKDIYYYFQEITSEMERIKTLEEQEQRMGIDYRTGNVFNIWFMFLVGWKTVIPHIRITPTRN